MIDWTPAHHILRPVQKVLVTVSKNLVIMARNYPTLIEKFVVVVGVSKLSGLPMYRGDFVLVKKKKIIKKKNTA